MYTALCCLSSRAPAILRPVIRMRFAGIHSYNENFFQQGFSFRDNFFSMKFIVFLYYIFNYNIINTFINNYYI